MEETCCYCAHHQWADHLYYHICIKVEETSTDKHEHFRPKCEFGGNCKQFKNSGFGQNQEK